MAGRIQADMIPTLDALTKATGMTSQSVQEFLAGLLDGPNLDEFVMGVNDSISALDRLRAREARMSPDDPLFAAAAPSTISADRIQQILEERKEALVREERVRRALNEAADISNALLLDQRSAARQAADELERLLRIEKERLRTMQAARDLAVARSSRSANFIAASAGLGPGGGGIAGSAPAQQMRIAVLDALGQLSGVRRGIGGPLEPLDRPGPEPSGLQQVFQGEITVDGISLGSFLGHAVQDGG